MKTVYFGNNDNCHTLVKFSTSFRSCGLVTKGKVRLDLERLDEPFLRFFLFFLTDDTELLIFLEPLRFCGDHLRVQLVGEDDDPDLAD